MGLLVLRQREVQEKALKEPKVVTRARRGARPTACCSQLPPAVGGRKETPGQAAGRGQPLDPASLGRERGQCRGSVPPCATLCHPRWLRKSSRAIIFLKPPNGSESWAFPSLALS